LALVAHPDIRPEDRPCFPSTYCSLFGQCGSVHTVCTRPPRARQQRQSSRLRAGTSTRASCCPPATGSGATPCRPPEHTALRFSGRATGGRLLYSSRDDVFDGHERVHQERQGEGRVPVSRALVQPDQAVASRGPGSLVTLASSPLARTNVYGAPGVRWRSIRAAESEVWHPEVQILSPRPDARVPEACFWAPCGPESVDGLSTPPIKLVVRARPEPSGRSIPRTPAARPSGRLQAWSRV
jgi:hypothetical protein